MKISSYFKLIRWKNLVILASTLLIIKFGFIDIFTTSSALNTFNFSIFLVSNVLIAAAGYVINDLLDIEIDLINKPTKVYINSQISVKSAYNLYFLLNVTGVLAGFYIANLLGFPVLALIPIVVSYLLYLYSTTLKRIAFLGNMVIAFLISLSIISLAFFDLILINSSDVVGYNYTLFLLLLDFAIFAFFINLVRELIKDIEDIDGDKSMRLKTLPIAAGIKFSKYVAVLLILILLVGILYFVFSLLPIYSFIFYYFIVTIILPLLYLAIKISVSNLKSDFNFISLLLKIIMIFGTLSIIFISISVKNAL
ncbi:MAG: geranylgeranylglycerol-phosphate geranylgeranyltransferase [Bacteroidetes bacterium]|nr:geranylgeranylglycerol-phosphate geranylgeranyltransferase [Bacteroidota bacterium]